jgi:hypothetical protein
MASSLRLITQARPGISFFQHRHIEEEKGTNAAVTLEKVAR